MYTVRESGCRDGCCPPSWELVELINENDGSDIKSHILMFSDWKCELDRVQYLLEQQTPRIPLNYEKEELISWIKYRQTQEQERNGQ